MDQWFTLVLRMENFKHSELYMITEEGITCLFYGDDVIDSGNQASFVSSGLTGFRYVINNDNQYIGAVTLKDLITSFKEDDFTRLIMTSYVSNVRLYVFD